MKSLYTRQSLSAAAWLICAIAAASSIENETQVVGNHPASYNKHGELQPWTNWCYVLKREVEWYQHCPADHGYPRFVTTTFLDGDYTPQSNNPSFIPAMQDGMGIISYLKYYTFTGKTNAALLSTACAFGDYLVYEANTPDSGKYPAFTRSTGWSGKFPQPPDCGSQADKPYEIEPDKGGLAGFALLQLYKETHKEIYLRQALQNARVLAANMVPGSATNSPWPFRVDYRTGIGRGAVSGNMSFILRLYDGLLALSYMEFQKPRDQLWVWIKNVQIPDLDHGGKLWEQFFEDHAESGNLTAWAPLNLARYLLEQKESLDPDWQADAKALINFVNRNFTSRHAGVLVCGEQTHDLQPWGGVLSTYGAVLAMYAQATGEDNYVGTARGALNFCLYAVNEDGCPADLATRPGRGGWQEDAHTDKLHNFVDAANAFLEWAAETAQTHSR